MKTLKITLTLLLAFSLNGNSQETMNLKSKTEYSNTQIPFIENIGQTDADIKFFANTFGGTVFISTDGKIIYSLPKKENGAIRTCSIKEEFIEKNSTQISGDEKAQTIVNDFRGNNLSQWKNNIPTYNSLSLGEIYDGIEVKLKAYGNNVEKLFCVEPESSPDEIKVHINGANELLVSKTGELEVVTDAGKIAFTKPIAYQEFNKERKFIDVTYSVNDCDYGFIVGDYDKNRELIIDPLLASTFIGGNIDDEVYEPMIISDSDGNIYLTGNTFSSHDYFPYTPNAYDTIRNGTTDRFISKFNGDLTTLISSTFYGGEGQEYGMGICFDNSNNIYIAGYTSSTETMSYASACFPENSGGLDAYIVKFDNDLSSILASTYLGGTADEGFRWPRIEVVVGQNGDVFIAGLTKSEDFPSGQIAGNDDTYNGGGFYNGGDAFIAKFDSELTTLLSSTYLGGTGDEWRVSLVLDNDDNAYISGDTHGSGFPYTTAAYDTTSTNLADWCQDIFISKFTSDLSSLSASTFVGTGYDEDALAIRLDNDGNVYVTGYSGSNNFPTTAGAINSYYSGGDRDVVVVKLDNDLSTLLASTYLGGSNNDTGEDMIIDENGDVYIIGVTFSDDFNYTPFAYDTLYNGGEDIFITKINNDFTMLYSSTYLGGNNDDKGQCILQAGNGDIYVAGRTLSYNYPISAEAYDTVFNNNNFDYNDCFITKFDNMLKTDAPIADFEYNSSGACNYSYTFTNISSGYQESTLWDFGDGTTSNQLHAEHQYSADSDYVVELTISNEFGTDSKSISISVEKSIVAAFDFIANNENVILTNQSENAETFLWDFGDQTTSTEENPSHQYSQSGSYTIKLIAYIGNCSDTVSQIIDIEYTGIPKNISKKKMTIAPNPNKGSFMLKFFNTDNEQIEIKIFNTTGRLVFHEKIDSCNKKYSKQINLAKHAKGTYYLQLISKSGILNKKFIVE
jgi:PKD repeat protein